ncbi:MAG TPA: tetratricopeptide repeat protein [Phenylobacterium sp.]|jgi:Flp pilus assembly protein TadD
MTKRLAVLAIVGLLAATGPALARTPADPPGADAVAQIRQAIGEQRLVDASRLLDAAQLADARDPRLDLLRGDIGLARANYGLALTAYRNAQASPATRVESLQGQGIALVLLGRSDEALAALQAAVKEDPAAWRAWNALGSEYDRSGRWAQSDEAYGRALEASGNAAIVLNNRGYSRLLQHRLADAVTDLVAALQKKPDFPEARTNLRLALASGGDYDRALASGAPGDQAALLNNAGFAAGMHGHYAEAEDLLGRALQVKGEYYARAAENLRIVRALAARSGSPATAAP